MSSLIGLIHFELFFARQYPELSVEKANASISVQLAIRLE